MTQSLHTSYFSCCFVSMRVCMYTDRSRERAAGNSSAPPSGDGPSVSLSLSLLVNQVFGSLL